MCELLDNAPVFSPQPLWFAKPQHVFIDILGVANLPNCGQLMIVAWGWWRACGRSVRGFRLRRRFCWRFCLRRGFVRSIHGVDTINQVAQTIVLKQGDFLHPLFLHGSLDLTQSGLNIAYCGLGIF